MKKFAFSLQYLLDVHKAKEQAAEQAMVLAMKAHAEAERAVLTVQEQCQKQIEVIEGTRGIVRRSDYSGTVRHITDLQQEIEKRRATANELLAAVEEKRVALRKEMTARKVLEKLGAKERDEWEELLRQDEQKMMDEIASGRFARRGKAE